MISIIVCSVDPVLQQQLSNNIKATIGVDYELIVADNKVAKKSISQVYNEEGSKAKFNILCFIHEDVILHTSNWGLEIVHLLSDGKTGLVGISGAIYKSAFAGSWSTCDPTLYRTNSIQHFGGKSNPIATNTNKRKQHTAQVAVIDGVFMATTKKVFEQYQFDDHLLKGFHGYDIDFALQVSRQYKVMVTYWLLLEHLSEGKLSTAWLESSFAVHNKWQSILPLCTQKLDAGVKKKSDYNSCACVLNAALKQAGNKKIVVKHYKLLITKFFSLNKLL